MAATVEPQDDRDRPGDGAPLTAVEEAPIEVDAPPGGVPRVLHLLTRDAYGGTEVQIMNLVTRTHPDRIFQAVSMLTPEFVVHGRLAPLGVQVRSIGGRFGMPGKLYRLVQMLRQGRFDVVETYGFKVSLMARVARLFAGRPALVVGVRGIHFTDGEADDRKARFAIRVERLLAWTVRAYAANSDGARRFLVGLGFPPDKFVVVINGVETDVPQADPGREGTVRVICVARIVPRKRHEVLLRALRRLRDEGYDVEAQLVGPGYPDFVAEMHTAASDLGLDGVVTFSGHLPPEETRQRLADSQVFVLCSAWEGLPGAVMEAMAASLPVVGTNVNGTDELVLDGETGYLVPVDDVDALADAIERLVRDPELRARMGAAGRERILDYSLERYADRRESFYRRLAGERLRSLRRA
jgi:glycosyltransferase involved in cell wall biosynthesis